MTTLRLRRARLWGCAETDLLLRDGVIADVGTEAGASPTSSAGSGEPHPDTDAQVLDLAGAIVLPGLVNTHAHIDKSWVGKPWQSYGGEPTTAGRIAHERARRGDIGMPGREITAATLEELLRFGTTALRTHVDVDLGIGLSGLEIVRDVLAERVPGMRHALVAFPQDGVLRRPGVDALLRRAAREGVDHIGGLDPAGIDRDPVGQLDVLFDIAGDHGCGVDLHLHDPGELGAFEIELILERTRALGLHGRVNLAHGFALADVDPARRHRLLDAIAELGVSLTTVAPVGRPPLPARDFRDSGVVIGLGTDGFRDFWSPYGTGDLLGHAVQHARMTGARTDADLVRVLHQATSGGLGFVDPSLRGAQAFPDALSDTEDVAAICATLAAQDFAPGRPADLVAVRAENPMDVLVRTPERLLTVIAGEVITPRTPGPVPGLA